MMSEVERRRTRTAAWVVLGVGAALVLVSLMNITITDRVIDTTFTVAAGQEHFQREAEGRVLWGSSIQYFSRKGACVLKGRVAVEGEGIYVAALQLSGLYVPLRPETEGRFVDGEFTFTVDAGNYWFTFDNTAGDAESHVTFVLDETRTGSPFQLLIWSCWPKSHLRKLALGE